MNPKQDSPSGEAAAAAATLGRAQTAWLPLQRVGADGFTLAELLVSVGVLGLLIFFAAQLFNSAATITTLGNKQMDADSQARQLLDRMAIDFAQMVKRTDVDYYVKSSAASPLRRVLQPGNDQIAFYSGVPGYYPPTGSQSPVSLVAYRVFNPAPTPNPCADCNKLQRLGKGLVWNAVSTGDTPVVFMPVPVASPIPTPELASPTPNPLPTPAWPYAGNMTTDTAYEVVGPQILRFEYYYLLKNGSCSDIPWITASHSAVTGMQDVSAIIVDIATIDPTSKVLLSDAQIKTFSTSGNAHFLADYTSTMTPGQLRTAWQNTLNGITDLPRSAVAGIRLYERFFYLSPSTL